MKNRGSNLSPFYAIKENVFQSLKVATLGIIVNYDDVNNIADIQPICSDKLKDGTIIDQPLLKNVPCFIKKGNVGELCIIIFLDKNMKQYINDYTYDSSKPFSDYTEYISSKRHNINNAIALCGINITEEV